MYRARTLAASILILAIAAPSLAMAAKDRPGIAVVDLRRAFAETKSGKAALKKLKTEFEKRQKELDKRQKDLLAWKEEVSKRFSLMTEQTRKEKQEEFQTRLKELQSHYQKLQKEMNEREQSLSKPILEKLQRALAKIAEDEQLDIIFHIGPTVVWSRRSLDITDQLIRRYERMK